MVTTSAQLELDALRELSARLGGNPLLVQASSGNTSIKLDDVLWIKASGKWLIQPQTEGFLVPVKLSRARRCLRDNSPIPETVTEFAGAVCASVETAMHALLPQKVVVHVHSVNAIAWSVRQDAVTQLGPRLAGLPWQFIPYTPSGCALAKQVEHAVLADRRPNVFVLGNHGLVVCADSCAAAEHLLADVEKCLAILPRPFPDPHPSLLEQALAAPGWTLPPLPEVHALATDDVSRRILAGGILYPCQAIFLPAIFQLVESHGVLCSKHMTQAEGEMLIGLADVIRRIPPGAPLRYLTASELRELSSEAADAYRRISSSNSQPRKSGFCFTCSNQASAAEEVSDLCGRAHSLGASAGELDWCDDV